MNTLINTLRDHIWSIASLFILLALSQTIAAHVSLRQSFDTVELMDLSAFYIIPMLLWLLVFYAFRRLLVGKLIHSRKSVSIILGMGIVIAPALKAISLVIDFGLRNLFGLIDYLDTELLIAVYPHFVSSLPENYLIYLLFIGISLIVQSTESSANKLRIKTTTGYNWINVDQLEAIYSDRNYVVLQLSDGQVRSRMTSQMAQQLFSSHGVIRIHRSVIINPTLLASVSYIGDQCYQLKTVTGKVYSSSARFKSEVQRLTM